MALQKIGDWLSLHMPDLVKHSARVADIDGHLKALLPEHLQTVCKPLGFQRGILLLGLTNNVYATELRFAIPDLISRLRTEGGLPQLVDIHIKTCPEKAIPSTIVAPKKAARPETEIIRKILSELI